MKLIYKIIIFLLNILYYGGAILGIFLGLGEIEDYIVLLGIPLSVLVWIRLRKKQ